MKSIKQIQEENRRYILEAIYGKDTLIGAETALTLDQVLLAFYKRKIGYLITPAKDFHLQISISCGQNRFKELLWNLIKIDFDSCNTLEVQLDELQLAVNELLTSKGK